MKIRIIEEKNSKIAVVESDDLLITDVQSALDLMTTVHYEYDCDSVIIDKKTVCEEFFDLKTKIAGEILQKFVTYQMKIALIGDFSVYKSKSLKEFITESNKGHHIFFVKDMQQAMAKLS